MIDVHQIFMNLGTRMREILTVRRAREAKPLSIDSFVALSGWRGTSEDTLLCASYCQPVPIRARYNITPTATLNIHPPTSHSFSNVIEFSSHATFWDYCRTLNIKHVPSFAFHAYEIVKDEDTGRRPSVVWEADCWVVQQNSLLCLAVGPRLYWDNFYSVFAVYLYDSQEHRQSVVRSGILIVPTQNVWGHSEDVQEDMSEEKARLGRAFWFFYDQIRTDAHQQVQLTFEYGKLPQHVIANEVPGHRLFRRELQMMKSRYD